MISVLRGQLSKLLTTQLTMQLTTQLTTQLTMQLAKRRTMPLNEQFTVRSPGKRRYKCAMVAFCSAYADALDAFYRSWRNGWLQWFAHVCPCLPHDT